MKVMTTLSYLIKAFKMLLSRKLFCLFTLFSCMVFRECKGDQIKGFPIPGRCNKQIDCPKFSVIHSEKEFEIRSYDQALWVSSETIVDSSLMGGLGKGLNEVIFYMFGENERKEKILHSRAVVMLDIVNSTYTTNIYVPNKYQNGGLPKPVTSKIKEARLPKYKYAAVKRVGFMTTQAGKIKVDDDAANFGTTKELNALKKSLQGTAYQRAATRDLFSYFLYEDGRYSEYELIIWFD